MLFSPDAEANENKIKETIIRGAEGLFDEPVERENLQVTVRIACEFHEFLRQSADAPELSEAEYIAETIRSGLDWFFSMGQTGGILAGLKLQKGFGPKFPSSFLEMKAAYNTVFEQLLDCNRSAKAVGLLLSLVQMMLLFMTAYFPSFKSFSPEETLTE